MKVTLYVAVSIDGFIAKKDGDSDWVTKTDQKVLFRKAKEKGCIVLGRKSYDQFYGVFYPLKGVDNLVVTGDYTRTASEKNVRFVDSPQSALKVAQDLGYKEVLLVGGGKINGSFLKENLIDEVFLSIHPIILGEGIKVFEGVEKVVSLEMIETRNLDEGLVQIHYRVARSQIEI